MATYWLTIAVMIGVLQMCTANPISVDEETDDVTKLFSASELERAKNADIGDGVLRLAKSYGLTFEELIKLFSLKNDPEVKRGNITVNHVTKACDILVPDHKTATDFSDAQEINLMKLLQSLLQVARVDEVLFIRSSVCAYLSQPSLYEANALSFGRKLIPYMRFRFLKMKNRNASGVERVYVAKKLCCVFEDRDNSSDLMQGLTFSGFPDEELNTFDERWSEFETTNTPKSFENVCDFLHSQNPSDNCGSA